MKIKIFCSSKDSFKKMSRQVLDWAEILAAAHVAEKALVSRIYKVFLQSTINVHNPM